AHLRPEELHEARLRPERLATLEARQGAPVVEPRDLDLDQVLREPLADDRVLRLRRRARDALAHEPQQIAEEHPMDDELARRGPALVREGRVRDRPAL